MRWWMLVLLLAGVARAEKPALFVVVQIDPGRAAFHDALRDEVANARREHLKPYLELWAPLCKACASLERNLEDPRVRVALTGTYIIMVNVDDWGDDLRLTGSAPTVIPTFYELRDDGRGTGRHTAAAGWGANRPDNIARYLDRFLHHAQP